MTKTHKRIEEGAVYAPKRNSFGIILRSFHLLLSLSEAAVVLVFPYSFGQDFQSSFDLSSALILLVLKLFFIDHSPKKLQFC